MYTNRAAGAALAIATAGLLLLAGCSSESYNTKTDHCAAAIKDRPAGDKSKPKACDGIKQDDYDTLNVAAGLTKNGIVDSDGNVDLDKLLSPADTP